MCNFNAYMVSLHAMVVIVLLKLPALQSSFPDLLQYQHYTKLQINVEPVEVLVLQQSWQQTLQNV